MSRKKIVPQKNGSGEHIFSSKPLVADDVGAVLSNVSIPATPTKHTTYRTRKEHESQRNAKTKTLDLELTHIYENEDGSLPDMKSFEIQKGGRFLRALLTVVISVGFLGGVVWFGYTKFQHQDGAFVENDVILSIGGERDVRYAEAVTYRVRFKNAQLISLTSATIEVRYPSGFVFTTSSLRPDLGTDNIWTLGQLNNGDGAFIDISGNLYGNVGEGQSFRVFLTYTPSNFSSSFQKVATQETQIVSAPVRLALHGPSDVGQGVASTFDITVTPLANEEVMFPTHLALVFEPNAPYVLQTMNPESTGVADRSWNISVLTEETTYHITGAFAGGESPVSVEATLLGWQEGQEQSDAYIIATTSKDIVFAEQNLSIGLVVNGSQQDITVQPGERINATLNIKNTTEEQLTDVRVRMLFDAPSLDNRSILYWQGIEDSADGIIVGEQLSGTVRRGQITWSAQNISALSTLDPGESISIDVSLPIKTKEQVDLAKFEAYDITVASDIQYDIAGEKEITAAVPLVMSINSDTTFEVRDEISESTHIITWLLSNSFHPLKDIEAKVDLYGNIDFDPADVTVPAGTIAYNKEEQNLVWKVDTMPVSVDVLALQFPIVLLKKNPSQTQLTSKITVTATDTITGKQILLIGDDVGL